VKLGFENRKQTIMAAALGVVALLIIGYWFIPASSTIASTTTAAATDPATPAATAVRPTSRHASGSAAAKKERAPQSLDPTLHLQQLAATEQIAYEGSGRNIFVSQADAVIPTPLTTGTTDKTGTQETHIYTPPIVAQQPPIPLKFFGFANRPGEPRKVFLSKGDDVFIAGEGEIVDRRYKVVRISPTSVDIQDVVGSGPPQSIPLTQGSPS
jgi:hypothetical protein